MKFLIRDDDTCGMTPVSALVNCYEGVWDTFPVCLSVTPFIMPSGADWNPEEFRDRHEPVALEENEELVAFLKESLGKKRIDIAMHGYNHLVTSRNERVQGFDESQLRHRGREYLYGDRLAQKTRDGKRYLEEILNYKVQTFVPPGNSISKEGLQSLIDNELNLIGTPGPGPRLFDKRPFDVRNFTNVIKRRTWKMNHAGHSKYPFALNYAHGHKEIEYYLLYPSTDLEKLKVELDAVHDVNGVFILSTHYHAFPTKIHSGQTMEEAFHAMLEHVAKKDNVEYVGYRELWSS